MERINIVCYATDSQNRKSIFTQSIYNKDILNDYIKMPISEWYSEYFNIREAKELHDSEFDNTSIIYEDVNIFVDGVLNKTFENYYDI